MQAGGGAAGAELSDAAMVHTLLLHPEDADDLAEVFGEFFPDVRPPRCVSKIGVDRPGLLVSVAAIASTIGCRNSDRSVS